MLTLLQRALTYSENHLMPMVVVVPVSKVVEATKDMVCMAGVQRPFSGRTLRTTTGCLTVRTSDEDPPSSEFAVVFVTGPEVTSEEILRWRTKAGQVATHEV